MASSTTNLPQAQAAYQASLDALSKVHAEQDALIDADPVDWPAYNAALAAAASAQATAQAALSVFKEAILNTPDVTALLTKLQQETATMTADAKALDATAATLTALGTAADTVTEILTAVAKFVAV